MTYLELKIRGEIWVAYPKGMCFPQAFASCYPFRGRGVVARVLFALNRLRLDQFILQEVERAGDAEVALFWPSAKRSTGRYYGYRVRSGKVVEYLKFATTEGEKRALRREAANVKLAQGFASGMYRVPECRGVRENDLGVLEVCFEPLPVQATTPPTDDIWCARVNEARKHIAATGYCHGDFAWHNFKAVGDVLWILDWEEMRKCDNSLIDEIALDFGLDYYWRKLPLTQIVDEFKRRYAGDRWQKAMDAVRDLQQRKITMGDVLMEVFR